MGRNEKCRTVEAPPQYFSFQAVDEIEESVNTVKMRFDEFEAIRLSDKLGYDHIKASAIMGVSRPTYTRLLHKARQKMALFLIDGHNLTLSGGSILFAKDVFCCKECRRPFKWEDEGVPTCPTCNKSDVLEAKATCKGICRCCEDQQPVDQ